MFILCGSNAAQTTQGFFSEKPALFWPPESVLLQQVYEMMREGSTGCAQCLVSSRVPHGIELVSDAFVRKFATAREVLLGKRLSELVSLVHGSSPHDWTMLFLAVSSGAIRRCRISALDAQGPDSSAPFVPFEEAVFLPVVDYIGGRISHVLVQFPPSILPAPIPSDRSRSLCRMGLLSHIEAVSLGSAQRNQKAACVDAALTIPTAGGPADCVQRLSDKCSDQVNALQQLKSLTALQSPTALPAIRLRPGNVTGADGTAEAATNADVVITSAMIEALRGQPLPAAARAVGVSATTFKRACRRLGIRRWGFRRGPGRRRGGQGTSDSPPLT